jgi:RNA-directed DNA polymerase
MKRGLDEKRAFKSAMSGRGSRVNAGASHMNQAFPARYFENMGFVSLLKLYASLNTNL